MPKRSRSRSLSRNGASATAAKRRRKQEDEHERDRRMALNRAAHRSTSNFLLGATIIQRKKGDYRSIALQYDPESFLTETCLGEMQHVCACGAVRFRGEPASMCCANGQVRLQHFLSLLTTSSNYMTDIILTPNIFWKILASTTVHSR